MSLISFLALVDFHSASKEPECAQSHSVSEMPTAAQCSSDTGQMCSAITMSERSPQSECAQMELFGQTLSAEDSRVRTLAERADVLALMESKAVYGLSLPELLARLDPDSLSWKTSQTCLTGGLEEYSETWPRSGLMLNGTAYQLAPLVRLTAETESGLGPTPAARDWKDTAGMAMTATNKDGSESNRTDQLARAVYARQLMPTPTVHGNTNRKGISKKAGDGLATFVARQTPGMLSPLWVEWLMGFPIGWTELERWETRWCRKSRK